MTSKKYFKDEMVRVSNTYMSADGNNNTELAPQKWDSTKTQGWITGLTTGSSWILYTGIGLGVIAILVVTISAIKRR